MGKGLQALNWLCENKYFGLKNYQEDTIALDYINVIESALYGLERVKELCLEHDIHDTAELDNTLTAYEILKKDFESLRDFKYKQLDALKTISDIIRDFNKGEFANAECVLEEITNVLKEVLL